MILDNPGGERPTSQSNGLHHRQYMGLVTLWIFWTQVAITDEWEISSAKGRIVEHRLDIDFHQLDLSSRYYQIKYCLLEFDNE